MDIAFLVTAHTDENQLLRLLHRLLDIGDVFLHIDKKSRAINIDTVKSAVSKSLYNLFFTERINTAWGGYSIVKVQKILLEAMFKHKNYDRVVLLSGLCYPLVSKAAIIAFFTKHAEREFVCGYDLSRGGQCADTQLNRVCLYHLFRDLPLKHNSFARRAIIVGSRVALKLLGLRKKEFIMHQSKRYDIYYGSQWSAVTGECAKFVLSELQNNDDLVRYFMTSYAPDELVIPTIVHNSSFAKNAIPVSSLDFKELTPLHYLNYTDKIWEYDERDYDTIMNSGKLFVRKLISNKSEMLVTMIDEQAT